MTPLPPPTRRSVLLATATLGATMAARLPASTADGEGIAGSLAYAYVATA
ncbi:hypothetical protein MOV66_19345 [Agrobacterium sp. SHOUNA12C]|uniref:Uncharacterized protein n=1 Tax=Rhizobium rhizogenes NBRC 13257 TaxID=1220581 RepID=A0AA87Q4N6_RHIRH|nr:MULTISPECIES: hypothetical protein [Rhizobium]MCJ9719308.1 hypothetical protein [Agrobacterium sp. BETTINA12B]MCJ9758812.1 hypothetical protein [Agrobacterium sp. SHOUNA12C]EJK87460.1 hypothetical protein PMI03_00996 [Rhizobium sp. AP16]MDJ1634359.1 hypothetical protein [Rhizobium rhizogenes]NTF50877.1 hypothetical protein [Rhizobium rhizogenes]